MILNTNIERAIYIVILSFLFLNFSCFQKHSFHLTQFVKQKEGYWAHMAQILLFCTYGFGVSFRYVCTLQCARICRLEPQVYVARKA